MIKGQKIYSVDHSDSSVIKLLCWEVSSIKRKTYPKMFRRVLGSGEKTVYLKRGDASRVPWMNERGSFALSDWPGRVSFYATKRAAWRAAIPQISRMIADLEEGAGQSDPQVAETKKRRIRLLQNMRIAKKGVSNDRQ